MSTTNGGDVIDLQTREVVARARPVESEDKVLADVLEAHERALGQLLPGSTWHGALLTTTRLLRGRVNLSDLRRL